MGRTLVAGGLAWRLYFRWRQQLRQRLIAPGRPASPRSPYPLHSTSWAQLPRTMALTRMSSPYIDPAPKLRVEAPSSADRMQWIFRENDVKIGSILGEGCFARTFRGRLRRGDSAPVAVKIPRGSVSDKEARREMTSLLAVGFHHNLVKFIGIVTIDTRPAFIMELCARGSLDKLHRSLQMASEPMFLDILADVLTGLRFLHSRNLVHRDVACRNLLMRSDGTVVLSDFGLSRLVKHADASPSGTAGYYRQDASPTAWPWTAPESFPCLESQPDGQSKVKPGLFSSKSDIWMVGVTVWEILTRGRTPHADAKTNELPPASLGIYGIQSNRSRLVLPLDCVSDFQTLLFSACQRVNPRQRPSASTALECINLYRRGGQYKTKLGLNFADEKGFSNEVCVAGSPSNVLKWNKQSRLVYPFSLFKPFDEQPTGIPAQVAGAVPLELEQCGVSDQQWSHWMKDLQSIQERSPFHCFSFCCMLTFPTCIVQACLVMLLPINSWRCCPFGRYQQAMRRWLSLLNAELRPLGCLVKGRIFWKPYR